MKKIISSLFLTLLSTYSFADNLLLKEYNYNISDLLEKGITKEELFLSMDRDFIKLSGSICSNRAHMWSFEFKRYHDIDAAKIFLFYTDKNGTTGSTNWWYHVAPVIGEAGEMYVMDAAFPKTISGPLTKDGWLTRFAGSTACKEISNNDDDLLKRMFGSMRFPSTTSHGTYDCYYKIVPSGYWYPASVAMNSLGTDSKGNPINFVRDSMDRREVYNACKEAVTTDTGRFFGSGKKKCKAYAEF